MEKLPVTSYVRLVDIWLIFGQLIPFIEVTNALTHNCFLLHMKVVLFTIVELFNDDESINHHGFKRMVPEKRVFTVRNHNEETDTIEEISNKKIFGMLVSMDFGKDRNIGEIAKTIGNNI